MPALGKHFARVTRFVRNLRGGSQPTLIEANDGKLYVLKFLDNIQGPMLPFNESFGTELYRACGLPVAPWTPLVVTNKFLDRNPACWMQTASGQRRQAAGVCFGSQFLAADQDRFFEILPGSSFARVNNPADFWVAWLLDVCCSHGDNRQAIFREEPSGRLQTTFIDFGHMFCGPRGDLKPNFRASRYRDERIYPRVTNRLMVTLRKITDNLDEERVWRQTAVIPDEWKTPTAIRTVEDCLNRLSDHQFIDHALELMVKSHQRRCDNSLPNRVAERSIAILHACIQPNRGAHEALLQ